MIPTLLRWAKQTAERGFRLHRLNIGPRLTACFLLIILAMLVGNGVLLWQFHRAQKQAERLTGVDQELIAVLQAHSGLMSLYERLDVLAQSEDTVLLLKQIETLHNELLEGTQRARNTLSRLPPEVQLDPALVPTLLAIQGELPAQLKAIATLAKSGAWDPLRLRLANQVRPLESRSAALVENVNREVGEQRAQAVLNIRQAQRRVFLIVPMTAAITLLFAAFLGSVITRSITHPLGRLVEGATALARGDFSHRVPATGTDEIGRLGGVFNEMIVKLQQVYSELQASETYLAEAQKLSLTGSFGWDLSTGEIYWSAETFRIFEFEPTRRVTVDAILHRTHAEDRSTLQQVMERAAQDRTALDVEHRLQMRNGSIKYVRVVGHPPTDKGNRLEFVGAVTDITDRKRAQEALAASERELRSIIRTIPTMIWSAAPDGSVDFFNPRWLDYTGFSADQSRDWRWTAAIHPDDLSGLTDAWRSILVSGESGEAEARIRCFDSSYRWFLIRANPLKDESGNILKWYGTNIDIDDRKRVESALQSSERNLSQMINAIPALIHTARPDGYLDYFNLRWLEYLGCSLVDVEGWKWTASIHPDDVNAIVDKWQACLASGEIFEQETRVRRGDGQYRWMFHRKVPLRDERGNIVRWYGTSFDIEDRKRAEGQVEQAYLRLAEAQRLSKTGSFIADLAADDHNWSEETFRIFEFDPEAKVTVQMIRGAVHPEDLPSFDAVIARGMTGTDVDFVFRIVTSQGAMKHVRGMARLMAQVGGRPLFIGALQDVTESKVAEEALDKARSELAHVARVTTLNALTASIAHEVNQPLSGIITNASTCLRMLNGDPPNIEGARETARRTIRDGNRASDVITRLRNLFSKKEFTPEHLDLSEATREVIALSLSDLQRNRVILRSELAEDLPPVIGDRVQLQQVILNLLRNASDAMVGVEDSPRQLLIRTRREGDDRVRLSVQDTGTGVNPPDLERVFEAFYTTKSGGMGIGLSVSRSIIERHHGRLWAEPNDGPGATFSFSIPCGSESVAGAASQ